MTAAAKKSAYVFRLAILAGYAKVDGVTMNDESINDFWAFVHANPDISRGGVVLLDNGCLRVRWRKRVYGTIGVTFLGGGYVQYARLPPHAQPEAGRVPLQNAAALLADFEEPPQ